MKKRTIRTGLLSAALFLGMAAISPAASVSPPTHNFGSVALGSSSAPVTVTASVTAADSKRRILFSVENQEYFKPVSSQATCSAELDGEGQLPPGDQSCSIGVVLRPGSTAKPGPASGSVEVRFVPTGFGSDTVMEVPLTGTVTGSPGAGGKGGKGKGKKCKKKGKGKSAAAAKKKCGKKKKK